MAICQGSQLLVVLEIGSSLVSTLAPQIHAPTTVVGIVFGSCGLQVGQGCTRKCSADSVQTVQADCDVPPVILCTSHRAPSSCVTIHAQFFSHAFFYLLKFILSIYILFCSIPVAPLLLHLITYPFHFVLHIM